MELINLNPGTSWNDITNKPSLTWEPPQVNTNFFVLPTDAAQALRFRLNSYDNSLQFVGAVYNIVQLAPGGYFQIFTLPNGYRPTKSRRLNACLLPSDPSAFVEIFSSGNVSLMMRGNTLSASQAIFLEFSIPLL